MKGFLFFLAFVELISFVILMAAKDYGMATVAFIFFVMCIAGAGAIDD